jgi:hypothetical protein
MAEDCYISSYYQRTICAIHKGIAMVGRNVICAKNDTSFRFAHMTPICVVSILGSTFILCGWGINYIFNIQYMKKKVRNRPMTMYELYFRLKQHIHKDIARHLIQEKYIKRCSGVCNGIHPNFSDRNNCPNIITKFDNFSHILSKHTELRKAFATIVLCRGCK